MFRVWREGLGPRVWSLAFKGSGLVWAAPTHNKEGRQRESNKTGRRRVLFGISFFSSRIISTFARQS